MEWAEELGYGNYPPSGAFVAHRMFDPHTSRLLGCLFDGVARHTQEGLQFVDRAMDAGWRQAIRERDEPFGDYGARRSSKEAGQ